MSTNYIVTKRKACEEDWLVENEMVIADLISGKEKYFMDAKTGFAVVIDKVSNIRRVGGKYSSAAYYADVRYLHNNKTKYMRIGCGAKSNVRKPIFKYEQYLASHMEDNNGFEIICYNDDYEEIRLPVSENQYNISVNKINKYLKYSEKYGKDCYIKVMDIPHICNPYDDFNFVEMKLEILRVVYDIKIDDPDWYKHLIFGYCRIWSADNSMPKDLKCLCLSFIGSLVDSELKTPSIYRP